MGNGKAQTVKEPQLLHLINIPVYFFVVTLPSTSTSMQIGVEKVT